LHPPLPIDASTCALVKITFIPRNVPASESEHVPANETDKEQNENEDKKQPYRHKTKNIYSISHTISQLTSH
jgi:hypothetical protein